MYIHDILRERLLKAAGVWTPVVPSLDELKRTQWCPIFETYMRNRLIMGYYRYEPFDSPTKKEYPLVDEAIRRIERYQDTGNTENLVDAANMCMLAFVHDDHPKKHFASMDDGEHCRKESKNVSFDKEAK